MNPIENGIIELVYQIGGQEQYAVVVLYFAKKDSHDAIPLQGEFCTPLQEHICFVQQKQSIPCVRCLKNVGKLSFQDLCVRAQFSGRDLVRQHDSSRIPAGPHTEYSGRWKYSESASAVRVFPTPGGPLFRVNILFGTGMYKPHCRSILIPRPFPSTTSSNASAVLTDRPFSHTEPRCLWATAIITCFFVAGIVRQSKGKVDQSMGLISSTAYSPN